MIFTTGLSQTVSDVKVTKFNYHMQRFDEIRHLYWAFET